MVLRKIVPGITSAVAITGHGRSTIYQKIKDGTFPQPVKLGRKGIGFVEDELATYNEARIAARDSKTEGA